MSLIWLAVAWASMKKDNFDSSPLFFAAFFFGCFDLKIIFTLLGDT